jgi:flagellar biosynthesis GTPase FlhF
MSKIVAIVTLDRDRIGGGAPIFWVADRAEQQQVAFSLEKLLDATAADLKNGTMILVDHN